MKKLNYNIYSNITDRQFLSYDKKLTVLQYKMSTILFESGWKLADPIEKKDGLGIDFINRRKVIQGNIGISFDDRPKKITFTFYITKSLENNTNSYFLRRDLFSNEEFSYFEDKIIDLTKLALEKYDGWNEEDIIRLGEKDELF